MAQTIKKDICFYVPFGIWAYFSVFWHTFLYPYIAIFYLPLSIVCMLVIGLRECLFLKTYTWKDILGAAFAIFGMIIAIRLHEGTVMYSCFLIFCGRHTDFRNLMKTCLISFSLSLLTIVLCSQIGMIPDYILDAGGVRPRHFLGFRYALYAPSIYFNLCAVLLYLRKQKITWIESAAMAAIALYLYKMTDSRLCFVWTLLLIIIGLLLKYGFDFFSRRTLLKLLMTFSLLLSALVSYGLVYAYQQKVPVILTLNDKLSNRLGKASQSLEENGLSLLDHNIEFNGNGLNMDGQAGKDESETKDNYVDCFYVKMLQEYGIVFFSLVLILYTKVLWHLQKKNELYILAIFSLIALHGILDDLIFKLFYHSFWMVGSFVLIRHNRRTDDEYL